jgi:CheY-like chemotaxis protein
MCEVILSEETKILVVDDQEPITTLLKSILSYKGYIVHTANSGTEALEVLKGIKVDIVLTDVRMPEMDGIELYREIRKTQPDQITFLMSGNILDCIIKYGLDEGIQMVLSKPLDINILIRLLINTVNTAYWLRT